MAVVNLACWGGNHEEPDLNITLNCEILISPLKKHVDLER